MAVRRCWEEAIIIQLQMRCNMRIFESLFPSTFIDVRGGRISVCCSLLSQHERQMISRHFRPFWMLAATEKHATPRFWICQSDRIPRLQVVSYNLE